MNSDWKTCNPCGEVAGPSGFMMPWVQVQWMNHLRVRDGLPPYTLEECLKIEADLARQIETAGVDKPSVG